MPQLEHTTASAGSGRPQALQFIVMFSFRECETSEDRKPEVKLLILLKLETGNSGLDRRLNSFDIEESLSPVSYYYNDKNRSF